jgi:uncharacterized coiled-coil protein SlyX
MTDGERLIRLEERYTHLQRHLGEQDLVILELSREVDRLKKELVALRGRFEVAHASGEEPASERPPHY